MAHKHIELVFDALTSPNNLGNDAGVLQAAAEQGGHVAVSTVPENINARLWVNELERVGRVGLIMVTSRLSPRATPAAGRGGLAAQFSSIPSTRSISHCRASGQATGRAG